MKKVGIVIVNYNGEKYQDDCMKSLSEMEYQDFEVCVVDNKSTDNSVKILKSSYPWVHVIECGGNYGFAEGNNIGIKYELLQGVEYILLLNNDVVLDSRLLTEMMNKANKKTVVVPLIYYYQPSDMIWYAGGEMSWKEATGWHYGMKSINIEKYDEAREVSYGPACCMLIPAEAFSKIGPVDKNYFMYFDDTDYCVRLQDSGYRIVYNPKAVMWHKVSSSTGGEKSKIQVYYTTRNHFYFIHKFRSRISKFSVMRIWTKYMIKFMLFPVRCKNDRYIIKGIWDYLHGRLGRTDNV